ESQQKHQSARVKVTLADQLAQAGGKPQHFLPAIFGDWPRSPRNKHSKRATTVIAEMFPGDPVSRVLPLVPFSRSNAGQGFVIGSRRYRRSRNRATPLHKTDCDVNHAGPGRPWQDLFSNRAAKPRLNARSPHLRKL